MRLQGVDFLACGHTAKQAATEPASQRALAEGVAPPSEMEIVETRRLHATASETCRRQLRVGDVRWCVCVCPGADECVLPLSRA